MLYLYHSDDSFRFLITAFRLSVAL
jgi:hypothetical protein